MNEIHDTISTLDTIARKLEVRAGLTPAPLRQERAAEWARALRKAERLLVRLSCSRPTSKVA